MMTDEIPQCLNRNFESSFWLLMFQNREIWKNINVLSRYAEWNIQFRRNKVYIYRFDTLYLVLWALLPAT